MKTMTKGLSLILCLAMLVAGNLSPALGEADDEETKTAVFQTSAEGSDCVFSYRLDEDGATITKAVWPNIFQPPEQLIIPSQVDGHPVIAIGADAFFPEDIHSVFREAMDYVNGPSTNVRLPGTLLRIEEDAFSGAPVSCVYIPKSVTEIQGNPFAFTVDEIIVEEGSPAFEMINGTLMDKRTQTLVAGLGGYFDKDDNYYDYAYDYDFDYDDYDNYDWKYLIPQGTVTIGPEALSYCSWETQPPVIPDTVTTIGYMAFAECSWWDQELVIPASVTHIEDFAFYGGYDLTRVSLPASLEFMGDNPFMYCGLESVTLHGPGDGLRLVDGALYDQRVKALVVLPSNAETVEFAIPEGTLRIDSGAFYNRKQLETVFIPDSVTSIGKALFRLLVFKNHQNSRWNHCHW